MKISKKIVLAASAIIASSACVYADTGNNILTNKEGMTLYVFDKDKKGESACYDACANNWPPFIAAPDVKAKVNWGFTTRKDGSKQWTYNNKPLYTWLGDKKVGDTNGDGVGGTWHIAKKSSYNAKGSYGKSPYSSKSY